MALGFLHHRHRVHARENTTLRSPRSMRPDKAHLTDASTTSLSKPTERFQVFDIWESQAAFDAFGETLLPILTGAGIGLNPPMVATVHNVIKG